MILSMNAWLPMGWGISQPHPLSATWKHRRFSPPPALPQLGIASVRPAPQYLSRSSHPHASPLIGTRCVSHRVSAVASFVLQPSLLSSSNPLSTHQHGLFRFVHSFALQLKYSNSYFPWVQDNNTSFFTQHRRPGPWPAQTMDQWPAKAPDSVASVSLPGHIHSSQTSPSLSPQPGFLPCVPPTTHTHHSALLSPNTDQDCPLPSRPPRYSVGAPGGRACPLISIVFRTQWHSMNAHATKGQRAMLRAQPKLTDG